jgi:Kef-type K+ transport system membrane component KefB
MTSSELTAYVFLDVVLILIAARIVGSMFTRIGQPRVVGEIVAGILLGPTLLGDRVLDLFPAPSQAVLANLGQVGLLLLIFLSALEIDLDLLRRHMFSVVSIGVGVVAVPLLAGYLISPMLANDTFQVPGTSAVGFGLFVGAMLAITALPVMARIFQEKQVTTSRIAAISLAAAAVCTVLMFVASSVASSISVHEGTVEILGEVALVVVYLLTMFMVVRPLAKWLMRHHADEVSTGDFVAVLVVAIGSGYVAHMLGLTVIVGGFVAGLILPRRRVLFLLLDGRLGELTSAILLPIFLAVSGLATDFRLLSRPAFVGLLVLLVAAVASKWIGGAVFARFGGISWAEGNVVGALMNCRGLLVLVVALGGVQQGIITPVLQLGAVLVALVTTAMTGPLFDRFMQQLPEPDPVLQHTR